MQVKPRKVRNARNRSSAAVRSSLRGIPRSDWRWGTWESVRMASTSSRLAAASCSASTRGAISIQRLLAVLHRGVASAGRSRRRGDGSRRGGDRTLVFRTRSGRRLLAWARRSSRDCARRRGGNARGAVAGQGRRSPWRLQQRRAAPWRGPARRELWMFLPRAPRPPSPSRRPMSRSSSLTQARFTSQLRCTRKSARPNDSSMAASDRSNVELASGGCTR